MESSCPFPPNSKNCHMWRHCIDAYLSALICYLAHYSTLAPASVVAERLAGVLNNDQAG